MKPDKTNTNKLSEDIKKLQALGLQVTNGTQPGTGMGFIGGVKAPKNKPTKTNAIAGEQKRFNDGRPNRGFQQS